MTAPVTAPESPIERLVAEGLIGMSAAARLYGSHRRGRPTHPTTPTRHCLRGVVLADGRTLRLEHLRVAGRLMTSRAAVLRFFASQQSSPSPPPDPNPPRSPARRQRESRRAEDELKRLGV